MKIIGTATLKNINHIFLLLRLFKNIACPIGMERTQGNCLINYYESNYMQHSQAESFFRAHLI